MQRLLWNYILTVHDNFAVHVLHPVQVFSAESEEFTVVEGVLCVQLLLQRVVFA